MEFNLGSYVGLGWVGISEHRIISIKPSGKILELKSGIKRGKLGKDLEKKVKRLSD